MGRFAKESSTALCGDGAPLNDGEFHRSKGGNPKVSLFSSLPFCLYSCIAGVIRGAGLSVGWGLH